MSTAAQRLRALATERFPTLTPAEVRLLGWVAIGEEAHYEDPTDPEIDLQQAEPWGPERTIHAEVLRWLCVDRDAIRHTDPKGLSIHGARIDGTLDLRMVTVPFPLFLVHCAIREPLNLEFAEVRVLGLIGSTIQALHGHGIVVHGDLRLRDGFDAQAGVTLFNATIDGDLDCEEGRFHNAGGTALHADGARIGGSVFLRGGFQAEGEVTLVSVTIGGNLDCERGQFHNTGRTALDVGETKIGGFVLLRGGFQAEGLVHFDGARVQGSLDCHGASFSGAARNGLLGEAMTVGRIFTWQDVTTTEATILNLAGAQVGQLADDKKSWPGSEDSDSRHLDLDGFVYGAIFDGPTDAPTRLGWLARQTPVPLFLFEWQQPGPSSRPFRPHPYQQLAKVLRERGQEADAKRVLIAKERERLKHGGLGWGAWCWNGFLGITMGHGYRPGRLLPIAVVFVLLGWALFAVGYRSGQMIPAHPEVYLHYERSGQVPPFYPTFKPLVYSLDTLLPVINFGQKDHWRPRDGTPASSILRQWAQFAVDSTVGSSLSRTAAQEEAQGGGLAAASAKGTWPMIRIWVTDGRTLHLYRLGHIAAGWLLITLGVAGVTGLVRKE